MLKRSKLTIMGLVSAVVLSFSVSPSSAAEYNPHTDYSRVTFTPVAATQEAHTASQLVDVTATSAVKLTHGFNVKAAIDLARSEIGTRRPTGWSQPGECMVAAGRWLDAGGANWHGGGSGARSTYKNATRLPVSEALPGDVIQYEYISDPDAYASGVHTMLIAGKNADGTFHIIQSNVPGGSGLVTEVKNWKPEPPAGFVAVAWRF